MRLTKKVTVGNVSVGGGESIKIQSMCTKKTSRTDDIIKQILALEKAGCDIIRVSVLDEDDARSIKIIKDGIHIPIVADIHFSHRLAISAIENGCDKVRINPGKIGNESAVRALAD